MIVVAIDGPTAAGKGTLARALAQTLGFAYLDTGSLYRAVGLTVLRAGGDPTDPLTAQQAAEGLTASALASLAKSPDIRLESTGNAASQVSVFPSVRAALLDFQRHFAAHPPAPAKGAVLDGRDIGTVVCPDAAVKVYVTASVAVRARRRTEELQGRGERAIEAHVLKDLMDRDCRDSQRTTAPLRPAEGALLLDTSTLTAEAALEAVLAHVKTLALP